MSVPGVVVPSPKSQRNVWPEPPSVNEPLKATDEPSLPVAAAPAFTVGTELDTVAIAVSEPTPPSSSVTVSVTV